MEHNYKADDTVPEAEVSQYIKSGFGGLHCPPGADNTRSIRPGRTPSVPLTMVGMVAAAAGLLVWISSAIVGRNQQKRMTPLLPLGLLVAYVPLFFVCV